MTTKQIDTQAAVATYAEKFVQQELARCEQRDSQRLARLLAENPSIIDTFRADWIAKGNQLVSDILEKSDEFCRRIECGAFHPDNATTRQLFESVTGIHLQATVNASRQQVIDYAGDRYTQWIDGQRQAQIDSVLAEAAAEAARYQAHIDSVLAKIATDAMIDGEHLIEACKALGVDLPIQTIGLIRRRVRTINSNSATISSGKGLSNSPYLAYRQCKRIIASKN